MTGCVAPVPLNVRECEVVLHVPPDTKETCLKAALEYEEKEYARIEKRNIDEETIRATVAWCQHNSKTVLLYQGPSNPKCDRWNARRREPYCIPKHARVSDYRCVDAEELMRAIDRMMRGGF